MAEQPPPDDEDADASGLADDTDAAPAATSAPDAGGDDPPGDAPADDQPAPGPADAADIAARLAELARTDPDALQAVHDAMAALGASCDPDNCPDAAKWAEVDDLAKALPRVEALERRLAAQDARIERLGATPLPPRTAASPHARAIGKADDVDPGGESREVSASEAEKAFAALTSDERAFLLMKASLRQPIPLG
jgi:hypothetical protein